MRLVRRRPPRITSILATILLSGLFAASAPTAHAEEAVSIEVDRLARLTSDGVIMFIVHVSCGPLPGAIEFTEGLAGAAQPKTGAEGEGGLSPDVVCDGTERAYTAAIASFTDAVFRHGPAHVSAAVTACATVVEEQVCVSASLARRVVITGRAP